MDNSSLKEGMPKMNRGVHGHLHLSITYIPLDWLKHGHFTLTTPRNEDDAVHHGLLFFRLLYGYNLAGTTRNYYCVLNLIRADTKKQRGPKKTSMMKNDVNPVWNENFEWYNVSTQEVLQLQVYSHSKFKDNQLGYVEISMADVAESFDPDHTKVIMETLEFEGGKGDVDIEIDWVPLDNNPIHPAFAVNRQADEVKVKSRELNLHELINKPRSVFGKRHAPRGRLWVQLLWAHNLINVDWPGIALGPGGPKATMGKSDPYCVLRIQGNTRESQIIWNDLNPVWKEEFMWKSVKSTDTLEIFVWDKGTLSDTILGRCDIVITDAANNPGEVHLMNKPLTAGNRSTQDCGSITLQMLFEPLDKGGADKAAASRKFDWPERQTESYPVK